jgi:hypothetical protein
MRGDKMKAPKRIELTPEQTKALLKRVQAALPDGDYRIIKTVFETYIFLSRLVDKKTDSVKRLLKMIFGSRGEKSKDVLKDTDDSDPDAENPSDSSGANEESPKKKGGKDKKKRKGHGRNGAKAYTGANKIKVAHPELKAKDSCPSCEKGKVYPMLPCSVVRITASPPIQANVYELEKLRCNLCGDIFPTAPPSEVGEEKYDEGSRSMIALLKYGGGFPFYRLEQLQHSLGIPLPASIQWKLVKETADRIRVVYKELIRQAAQADVIHHDDTAMKILELMKKEADEDKSSRKGIFTSGFLSRDGKRRIALFFTGQKHAGENMKELLAKRHEGLAPPIQMCDALSRNMSEEFVLEILQKVYENDAKAKEQNMSPQERLKFHQKKSGLVMGKLRQWLLRQFKEKTVEPNSGLGKAITYMLKHWKKLTLFLKVPDAPLDNNICERALKKAILHRKNSLFYKTENGADVGDLFMSLIYTCKLSLINPFDYLNTLQKHSSKLLANPQDWMPWNYQTTLAAVSS